MKRKLGRALAFPLDTDRPVPNRNTPFPSTDLAPPPGTDQRRAPAPAHPRVLPQPQPQRALFLRPTFLSLLPSTPYLNPIPTISHILHNGRATEAQTGP